MTSGTKRPTLPLVAPERKSASDETKKPTGVAALMNRRPRQKSASATRSGRKPRAEAKNATATEMATANATARQPVARGAIKSKSARLATAAARHWQARKDEKPTPKILSHAASA